MPGRVDHLTVLVTSAVLSLLGFAAERGVSPPELLGALRLRPELFAAPTIDLSQAQELRLWAEAARLTGDADFGLHMSEWLVPRCVDAFDVLAFALRSCATLGDHYRRASRYMRLVHSGIFLELEEGPNGARLVHGHFSEPRDPPRQPVEGLMALSVVLGRQETGVDFAPTAVFFRHARPADDSEHKRIFRAPVHFGCERNEVVFEPKLLELPQLHAEPRLLEMLNRQLEGRLAAEPANSTFLPMIRRVMLSSLPDGEPSISGVAAALHMSPRTLQRRLQAEGATFAGLLADVRKDLAIRYLQDQRISIGEVGFLLGFHDVTAFHRAFKRWTSETPARFRRQRLSAS